MATRAPAFVKVSRCIASNRFKRDFKPAPQKFNIVRAYILDCNRFGDAVTYLKW